MALITKRRLTGLISASAVVATVIVAAAPAATLAAEPLATSWYRNGFEKATKVASPVSDATKPMFNVTRVASKSTGIKAASGRWYAKAGVDAYAFTRYGGYRTTFGNGYTTSVDVFLDMNKAVGGDRQFDWSSAPFSNDPASGGYGRDFIFSVGEKPSVPGSFVMSASNNAPGNPAGGASPLTVSRSGWYTFKHEFKNVGGTLSVDMSVIFRGQVLKTWTLSDPSDIIGATGIGGNRYGWLVDNDFAKLALDNVTRVSN